ncbi:MAG: UvrD-helicase domain-containing protein, partial [Candidatus Latescibacterota bacterium]
VSLVRDHGIAPEHIIGLTFTRNAAQAMRTRLDPALGSRAGRVTLATIHSFCYSLLKRETGQFTLLAGRKQVMFLRGILREFPLLALPAGSILREISLARGNLLSPGEFRILHENNPDMRRIALIMDIYQREKAKKRMLDFDDLLWETFRILRERPEVRNKRRKRFRHILVDEFQDTNPALMEVIRLLYDES